MGNDELNTSGITPFGGDDLAMGQAGGKLAGQASDQTPEQIERARQIEELASQIDLTTSGIESTYGRDVQDGLSNLSVQVLEKTKSKDLGDAGELLRQVVTLVSDEKMSGFKRIPIIGKVAMDINALRRNYQQAEQQVDDVVVALRKNQVGLEQDIVLFDQMYEKSVESYRRMDVVVEAGRLALRNFNEVELPRIQREAELSGDPMKVQQLRDLLDRIETFEKRLDDINRIKMVTVQQVTQIRMLQKADREIANKIETTISTTIPVWRSQLVIALGLDAQRKAIDTQAAVDAATNDLIRRNSEMLKQGSIDAAKASQRSVVDLDTLQEVNRNLIDALNQTIRIQDEGRAERERAWEQIDGFERELKDALVDHARQLNERALGQTSPSR